MRWGFRKWSREIPKMPLRGKLWRKYHQIISTPKGWTWHIITQLVITKIFAFRGTQNHCTRTRKKQYSFRYMIFEKTISCICRNGIFNVLRSRPDSRPLHFHYLTSIWNADGNLNCLDKNNSSVIIWYFRISRIKTS